MLIFMLFQMDFSRPFLLQSVILFTHSIRLFKSTPHTGSLYVTNSYLHTLGKLLLPLKSSYLFIMKLRSKLSLFIKYMNLTYRKSEGIHLKKNKLQMIICSITETSCVLVFITWQLIIMLSRSVASDYLQPHGL